MAVTEVTSENIFTRLGNSIKSVVTGVVLIVAGIALLWWNEGRTVHRAKTLETGRGICIEGVYDKLDNAHEGKLVHISGNAATTDVLKDDTFGVSVNGFKLIRTVEMYQWHEKTTKTKKEKVGGTTETTTTYTYECKWSSTAIDSSNFKEAGHQNPPMRFTSETQYASSATFGAHRLNESQIKRIGTPITYSVNEIPAVKKALEEAKAKAAAAQAAAPVANADATTPAAPAAPSVDKIVLGSLNGINGLTIHGDSLYYGLNPMEPQVGDHRISFKYVPAKQDISLIAQQTGDTFCAYATKTGNLDELTNGIVTADAMFTSAENANTMMCWILRLGGFLAIFIGFKLLFGPLPVLASVIPFLGSIADTGITIVAFALSAFLSLVVIAIAWIFYRPVLGIVLIAAAVALVFFVRNKFGKKE